MSILVKRSGFSADDWEHNGGLFIDLEKFGQDVVEKITEKTCLDIPNDARTEDLTGLLEQVAMIRIAFPSFADGRGFSVARQLRQYGYRGRLRAVGHVIADQFGFALTVGFDEVEISEDLAERQPETQWLMRLPQNTPSYQDKWLGEQNR